MAEKIKPAKCELCTKPLHNDDRIIISDEKVFLAICRPCLAYTNGNTLEELLTQQNYNQDGSLPYDHD